MGFVFLVGFIIVIAIGTILSSNNSETTEEYHQRRLKEEREEEQKRLEEWRLAEASKSSRSLFRYKVLEKRHGWDPVGAESSYDGPECYLCGGGKKFHIYSRCSVDEVRRYDNCRNLRDADEAVCICDDCATLHNIVEEVKSTRPPEGMDYAPVQYWANLVLLSMDYEKGLINKETMEEEMKLAELCEIEEAEYWRQEELRILEAEREREEELRRVSRAIERVNSSQRSN